MKKLLFIFSFLLCALLSYAQFQNTPPISSPGVLFHVKGALKGDLAFMLPVVDTLNNPATPYYGALTVRPQDSSLAIPPVYLSNGHYWVRIGGINKFYVDSINVISGSDYYWINGVSHLIGARGGSGGGGGVTTILGTYPIIVTPTTGNAVARLDTTQWHSYPFYRTVFAPISHFHSASDIISGTLPIARGGTGMSIIGTPGQLIRVASDGIHLEYADLSSNFVDSIIVVWPIIKDTTTFPGFVAIGFDTTYLMSFSNLWSVGTGGIYRNSRVQVGPSTGFPSKFTVVDNTLTNAFKDSSGLTLINNTVATSGAPKFPPSIVFSGSGFNTTAGVAYGSTFRIATSAISASTTPTQTEPNFYIQQSRDGGTTYNDLAVFTRGGAQGPQLTLGNSYFGGVTSIGGALITPSASIGPNGMSSSHGGGPLSSGTNTLTNALFTEGTGTISGGTNTLNNISINATSSLTGGTTLYRSIYINTAFSSSVGLTNVAFENTSGDLKFNTASGKVILNSPIKTKGYTVATLPTGTIGDVAYVTDATTPTYLGTLTGGGSVICPVFYNGTAWVSH